MSNADDYRYVTVVSVNQVTVYQCMCHMSNDVCRYQCKLVVSLFVSVRQ